MKLSFFLFFIGILGLSSQNKELPKYFNIVKNGDSVYLTTKNSFKYPIHIVITSFSKKKKVKVLFPNDSIVIFKKSNEKFEETEIVNNYTFKRNFGNPYLKRYDTLYRYSPPFKKNHRYKVLQGYHGKYTHNDLTSRYALDFQMPIGDTVCAARKGFVIKTEDKFKKGGRNPKLKPYANFILIYHDDGTVSQYVHLKHKGVLVKPGDFVKKGQAIGLSGNTGWSTEPHLHFSIYVPKNGKLISIPSIFNGVSGEKFKKGIRINY